MHENRVVPLRQPDEIDDPLTEILRSGAKRLVQQAVEAEFAAFLTKHAALEAAGRAPARCPARARSGAPDPDWDRTGRGDEAEGARSRGDGGGRTHPLFVGNLAEMGATANSDAIRPGIPI